MNTYIKYCPNVFLAKCEQQYQKGDVIEIITKYNKVNKAEVFNLIGRSKCGNYYYYSIVNTDSESYAARKLAKYESYAQKAYDKSEQYQNAAMEGHDFLVLGEPIKVDHHSKKRHRALIERNNNRMRNCIEQQEKAATYEQKAEYWAKKAAQINLSMPESLEFYTFALEKAKELHAGLKNGLIKREHSFSLTYANKEVKELQKKFDIANKLWGGKLANEIT